VEPVLSRLMPRAACSDVECDGAGWIRLLVIWLAQLNLRSSRLLAFLLASRFARVVVAGRLMNGYCSVGGGIGIGTEGSTLNAEGSVGIRAEF
jgi:hypothetical protein